MRPVGLGEILDGAVTYIRQNPKATLGLSALIAGVSQIILAISSTWLNFRAARAESMGAQALDSAGEVVSAFGAGGALLVTVVVTILASLLLTGMLTSVVGRAVLGQRVTIGEAWRQAAPRVPALLGAGALITLMITVAAGVLITPGVLIAVFGSVGWGVGLAVLGFLGWVALSVWIFVSFALSTPAIVLERIGIMAALSRSRALVRGPSTWWRAFGILLLAWIIAGIIQGLLQAPFGVGQFVLGLSGNLIVGQVVATVGAIVAATVVSPFSSGVPALLYVDMRMRREGFDIRLQRAVGVTGPPPATAGGPPPAPGQGPQRPPQGSPSPYGWGAGGPYGPPAPPPRP